MPIFSTCFRVNSNASKFDARFVAVRRTADDADELVEVRQRDEITFERFGALLGLAQFVTGPAQNDFAPMIDVSLVRLLERKQLRPAMIDREHVDRERAFHRGVLVEIVDDDLRDCASRFNSMTTRVFSSDSSRIAVMSVSTLSFTRSRDALDQRRAVHVVRNLGDDDLLAVAL